MKKHIRRIAAILACLMLTGVFASCAEGSGKQKGEYNGIGEYDGTRATTPDNLPDWLDYDGATITVFYRNGLELTECTGEAGSDLVYNAVYERNEKVSARLNIEFEWVPSRTGGLSETTLEVVEIVASFNDAYDYILTTNNTILRSGLNSYMYDFRSGAEVAYNYVELDQPWWWMSSIEEMSYDGKTYNYLVGEMNLINFHKMSAFYFNTNLTESVLGLYPSDMYAKVDNGTWTLDELHRLLSLCYMEKDGDNMPSEGDQYGMPMGTATINQLALSTKVDLYERTGLGTVALKMNSVNMETLCEKLTRMMHNNQGVQIMKNDEGYDTTNITDFTQRKYVFLAQRFTAACHNDMREMEDDYGILPYPTLNEGDEYVSFIQSSSTCVSCPQVIGDERFTRATAVLEAMASESYRSVTENFYEYALKSKNTRDEDSARMIDIIYNSSKKYFIDEYNAEAGNIMGIIAESVRNQSSYSRLYASKGEAAQNSINNFIIECQRAAKESR